MSKLRVLLAALSLSCALPAAPAQQTGYRVQFETLQVEPYLAERAGALAAALGFASWPRPAELYAPPPVGRVLFDEPGRLAEEVRSCTTVRFGDEPWGHCVWSWKGLGEGRKPAAADSLQLEITLAPSSRAAQERLLTALADNMLPTEGLLAFYAAAERPADLGDVAFLVRSRDGTDLRLAFTRGNLALRLHGRGALRDEVLPLARRLDEKLIAQQPLTPEQLRARGKPWIE